MIFLRHLLLLLCLGLTFLLGAQSPCVNGLAAGYECENVDLLAHVPPSALGGATTNEVWGWTDPLDGKEYVLLGLSTGVAFFDIANPVQPVYLGILPTHSINSLWRTFRPYNNYLFVGSEANGHGMQIFDLTRLRDVANPPETFTEDQHYDLFSTCHSLVICEETGFLYACGTDTYGGGLHIVNIQDPLNPAIAGGYIANGYTHEAFVIVYNGPDVEHNGKVIAFCFNGNAASPLTIADVTNPDDAMTISLSTYPAKRYCHQGWLTEDKGYMLVNDELDEYYNFADSLHTHLFDMHDLDNPQYMGYHVGGTAIDHNNYIVGNLAYQSNYTDGLSILDVTQVSDTVLTQVAFFDHYPNGDPEVFQGEWLNYPFFESGVVPVSDIYNGLFLLQPNFIRVSADSVVCSNQPLVIQVTLEPGFVGPFSLAINGLPEGATMTYTIASDTAPVSFLVTMEGLNSLSGSHSFELSVAGINNTYSRTLSVEFQPAVMWYYDEDGDGFGDENMSLMACAQEPSYVSLPGDCNVLDPSVFPDAPGTFDNIDNNCDGVIEGEEQNYCADLDNDGLIGASDIVVLVGNFGCAGVECLADINVDGATDITDLLILIADYAEFCP